jgi:hypothetical protein
MRFIKAIIASIVFVWVHFLRDDAVLSSDIAPPGHLKNWDA